MSKKILFAGPWVGEFGWELFCWQGVIRKMSKEYDQTIVSSRPGNEYLYRDFATEFIPYTPNNNSTNGWQCDYQGPKFVYQDIHSKYNPIKHIPPNSPISVYIAQVGFTKNPSQEIFRYGKHDSELEYDVVIHARYTDKGGSSFRNWSKEKYDQLVLDLMNEGFKVAAIGSSKGSYCPTGADNFIDNDLEKVCNLLSSSKLCIGPSSGPMHLASLCYCKHLVWSDHSNYNRYTKDWNPLQTPVIFYDKEGWNPEVNNIKQIILNEIK